MRDLVLFQLEGACRAQWWRPVSAGKIHSAMPLVPTDYLRYARNNFQVPRQEVQTFIGEHRVTVEANSRAEVPNRVRVSPQESDVVVFQAVLPFLRRASYSGGYNPFAISWWFGKNIT